MDRWSTQREDLWHVCGEMYHRGLVSAYSGNASLRLTGAGREGLLLITPHHLTYYRLKPEDLVVIDLDGEVVEGSLPPSSEALLHLELHRERRDVAAVVHTHSTYASIAAVAGREIPPIVDEMVFSIGGSIRVAEYAFAGSKELAEAARRTLGDRNAALLRNHGVVAVGPDIWQALEIADLVERLAKVFVLAQSFGPGAVNPLPTQVIDIQEQLFRMKRKAS